MSESERPATALPWIAQGHVVGTMKKGSFYTIAEVRSWENREQNASYIARACNVFPLLSVSLLGERLQREEVVSFALLMENKLATNAHKDKGEWHKGEWHKEDGWQYSDPAWLLERLRQETEELAVEVSRLLEPGQTPEELSQRRERVRLEAADAGNFAMMIADRCGDLRSVVRAHKLAKRQVAERDFLDCLATLLADEDPDVAKILGAFLRMVVANEESCRADNQQESVS